MKTARHSVGLVPDEMEDGAALTLEFDDPDWGTNCLSLLQEQDVVTFPIELWPRIRDEIELAVARYYTSDMGRQRTTSA